MSKFNKLIEKWTEMRQRGDVNRLAKILKVDQSRVSRILNKEIEPFAEEVIKIKTFYDKRAAILASISDSDQD